ncbi:MAG: glycosyltransferase family 39 protein, partial [Candidatus Thiodiazotropha sp.]
FLTKGPVALFIPALVSLLFCLWSGRLRQWFAMVTNPYAWLIFLLIGLPWYVAQYLKDGAAFLESFIGTHNIGRFSSAMEGHAGYWWYYLPVVLLLTFPFSLPALRPFLRLPELAKSDIGRFKLSWFLFVLVFFSFSATKLPHYMLYGVTPLFILAALQLDEQSAPKSVFLPLALFAVLLLLMPTLIERAQPSIRDPYLHAALQDPARYFDALYYAALLVVLALSLWLAFSPRRPRQGVMLAAGLFAIFLFSELVVPLVARIQQAPIKQAGLIAARYPNTAVMWRLDTPSFSVYSGKITPNRSPRPGELVLTKSRYAGQLPRHQTLYEGNGITLALLPPEETGDVPVNAQPAEPSARVGAPPGVAGTGGDAPAERSQPSPVPAD